MPASPRFAGASASTSSGPPEPCCAGGLGGRLDHTLANLSALYHHRDMRLVLCGDGNLARLIPAGACGAHKASWLRAAKQWVAHAAAAPCGLGLQGMPLNPGGLTSQPAQQAQQPFSVVHPAIWQMPPAAPSGKCCRQGCHPALPGRGGAILRAGAAAGPGGGLQHRPALEPRWAASARGPPGGRWPALHAALALGRATLNLHCGYVLVRSLRWAVVGPSLPPPLPRLAPPHPTPPHFTPPSTPLPDATRLNVGELISTSNIMEADEIHVRCRCEVPVACVVERVPRFLLNRAHFFPCLERRDRRPLPHPVLTRKGGR